MKSLYPFLYIILIIIVAILVFLLLSPIVGVIIIFLGAYFSGLKKYLSQFINKPPTES